MVAMLHVEGIGMEAPKHDKATQPRYPTCSQMINTAYCISETLAPIPHINSKQTSDAHLENTRTQCVLHTTLCRLAEAALIVQGKNSNAVSRARQRQSTEVLNVTRPNVL